MGRVFFVLALAAAGLLLWRSGRLDFIIPSTMTPLERKARTALVEAGWHNATVEERDKEIVVHIPLQRESEIWRAADEGRRACTRVAEAFNGQTDVMVIVTGAVSESGRAPVYGCAGYSAISQTIYWEPYN